MSFISILATNGSWSLSDHRLSGLSGKEPGPKSRPPPANLRSAVTPCPHRPLWLQHPSLGPKPKSHVPSCLRLHPQMHRLWLFASTTLAHFWLSLLPNHPMIYEFKQTQTRRIQPALHRLLSTQPMHPILGTWSSQVMMRFYFYSYFHHIILSPLHYFQLNHSTWLRVANAPPWPITVIFLLIPHPKEGVSEHPAAMDSPAKLSPQPLGA